jgi:seryl-tRNA(Sec) selenium transferase
VLIAISHSELSANEIEAALRCSVTPVISRIADGAVLLDLRTVAEDEEHDLEFAILSISA